MTTRYTLADLDPSIIVEPTTPANAAVIWLHGLGADGHDFEGILPQLNLPKEHGIRFIFPHAPVQPVTVNGGMSMRSWYDIYSMTIAQKVDVDGINQSSELVNALIEQQVAQGIPANKIVLAGFSQGGLVVLHTALHSPQMLAGVMALSTYYPSVCQQESVSNLNIMPIYMAHGSFDQVIPLTLAEKSKDFLQHLGLQVEWHTYPMEHSVCMAEIEHIANWLKARLC
ncbi:MAG: alpha/beta hydrolase-fold protein [Thiomicrorhabdus sp.]|nr:alpha/beta hydrolase-fold protein [Thiomicrorhabdus sp.]